MAEHVCPFWIGYLLASPIRKLGQSPEKILGPHVREGMTVMDVGCAMGFFSLPLARMVGASGAVICLDMQERMLLALQKRAAKAGLADRVRTRLCRPDSLGISDLAGKVDFALAFAMVHEVPDPARLVTEIHAALRPSGTLLVAEPTGHVSADAFERTLALARERGFTERNRPSVMRSRSVLLVKGQG